MRLLEVIHLRHTLDKLVGLFCIIVFLTFMVNHGHIDFSGVDWVRRNVSEAVQSPDGQECIEETKDISKGISAVVVFQKIFSKLMALFETFWIHGPALNCVILYYLTSPFTETNHPVVINLKSN